METAEERVTRVAAKCLKVDGASMKLQDSFTADLGADSVQSVELVAMFEGEFDIEMDEEQALAVETVGGAVEYVRKVCREQGKPADK